MSFEDFVNSPPTEIEGPRAVKRSERYTCGKCGGTGKWSGGINRYGNSDCIACRGRGYFTTSPDVRAKARASAQKRRDEKAEELRREIKAFAEANPDMFADLCRRATEFTASLHDQLMARGSLSERQIAAWNRGWEKLQAARAARAAETQNKGGEADLSRIREMFEAATASGFKKPVYRAEGLKITLAPATGRNAGCLYVVEIEDDSYQGKMDGVTFKAVRDTRADTLSRLQAIAANPMEAAVRYGRKTGRCSCCGRELNNKISVEMGIGPVCREKWGL